MDSNDRIKGVIDAYFADPTNFPSEFKQWLPSYLEVNQPRLSFGNISGAYTTASTVAGLGAGINGRQGLVRAGSTPYDVIQVVYDGVYGHWVSNPFQIMSPHDDVTTTATTSTGGVEITSSDMAVHMWRTFDTAGLAPQTRSLALLRTSNALGVASIYLDWVSRDYNTAGFVSHVTGNATTTSSTTGITVDSGWIAMPAVTLADAFYVKGLVKTSNAIYTSTVQNFTTHLRWVSK